MTFPGNPNGPGQSFADPGYAPSSAAGVVTRSAQVNLSANAGAYQQQMGAAAASTAALSGQVGNLLTKVDNLFKAGGRTLQLIGAGDVASMSAAVGVAANLQHEMSTLNATAAVNKQSMTAYGNAVDATFSKFPTHQADVVALVTQLTDLGTKSRDVQSVSASMTKLGLASGESIPQLTSDLVQLNRELDNTSPQKIAGSANAVLTLAKAAGTAVDPILSFGASIAPIARQAGMGEAAILGIGTAFAKAGQDGYYAGNTFNSIVTDLTTFTRTGSPELAKYATFVGKTVDQFRRMPAKSQVTDIFDAIAKGGPRAINFMNDLGLGTRGLAAVQAVAQQGGLGKYIGIAERSIGNTHNLDRGASAAVNNLVSTGDDIRNQLTRFAEMLGGPLLTPVGLLAKAFDGLLTGVNDVVHALGPVPAILGMVAGALLPIAGLMLGHAGLVAGAATARLLLGKNSGPRRAFAEGRATSGLVAGGMPIDEAMAATETGVMITGGNAPFRARAPFTLGTILGEAPAAGEAGSASMLRKLGFTGIMGLGAGGRGYFKGTSRLLSDATLNDFERSAYQSTPSVRERLGGFGSRVSSAAETSSWGRAIGREAGSVIKAGLGTAAGTIRTGMGLAGEGVGAVGGLLGKGLRSAGSFAMSGPGLAAMLAAPLALSWLSGIQDKQNQVQPNIQSALNPLTQYNQALGLATGKLASFAVTVDGATKAAAGQHSTTATFRQAKQVTLSEVAQFYNQGSSDQYVNALSKYSPGDTHAAAALMTAYGITNPRQLNAFGQQLLGAGYTPRQVRTVLSQYKPGATPDYRALAWAASRSNAAGGMADNPSAQSTSLIGAALTGLSVQRQTDIHAHGGAYAATKYFSDTFDYLTTLAAGVGKSTARYHAFIGALQTVAPGMTAGQWSQALGSTGSLGLGFSTGGTTLNRSQAAQVLGATLGSTGAGKRLMDSITGAHGSVNIANSAVILKSLLNAQSTSTVSNPFGLRAFFNADRLTQSAIGSQSANPVVVAQATTGLATAALTTNKSFAAASAALTKLSDTMGGADTASGRLAAAAASWVRTLQSFSLPYQSRVGQLGMTAANVRTSYAASQTPGATNATQQLYQNDRAAYEQQKQSFDQFMISTQQTAIQFNISRVRAEQDYQLQVERSTQDFHISQERAQQDYQLQVSRSERDFQLQMTYSEQDYLRQRSRNLQDFNISQARAAQQAAENIYDPFSVVQAQQVESGGFLASNLASENQRIIQQYNQLKKLKAAGLSQGAIDTLQLSNPNNAQEVNALVNSVINDPSTIARINRMVATRQAATTRLTQSSFNEQFRNTVADFHRELNRAAQDYEIANERARTQQSIALSDMAYDFSVATSRAQDDQARAMNRMQQDFTTSSKRVLVDLAEQFKQFYGSFGVQYEKTLAAINADIGKYAPRIAMQLARELNAAVGIIQNTSNSLGINTGGSHGQVPGVPGASRSQPNTQPGVMGINPSGQIGHYGPGGHFFAAHNLTPQQAAQYSHEHISSRRWANRHMGSGPNMGAASPVSGHLSQERTDEGVDWGGQGDVHAVGSGTIVRSGYDRGWGGTITILKLDNPPSHDRQYVYYAENITPTVHAGERVRAGQVIGHAHGQIEIGWADGATGYTMAHKAGQGTYPTGYGNNFRHWIHNRGGGGGQNMYRASPEKARAYARARVGGHFSALDALWNHESSWRWFATGSPTKQGRAYGIPQALPGSKMAGYGDWRNDAGAQIDWGLAYIAGRYGTPEHAWAKWQQRKRDTGSGWYKTGSIFTGPQSIGVGENGPEMVLPLDVRGQQFMATMYDGITRALMARMSTIGRGVYATGPASGGPSTLVQDYHTEYSGPIQVQAADPLAFERALAARARLKRLTAPGRRR